MVGLGQPSVLPASWPKLLEQVPLASSPAVPHWSVTQAVPADPDTGSICCSGSRRRKSKVHGRRRCFQTCCSVGL
jgi:hypothetical protein